MFLLGNSAATAVIKTKPCKTVNASSIPQEVRNTFKVVPAATETRNPGYNVKCDCYYWGYRPEILKVLGLGSVYGNEWNVCLDAQTSCPTPATCPSCPPPKTCPKPTICPACPPPKATSCPQPIPCPTCAPCDSSVAPPKVSPPGGGGAYGPTLGFLLAATVVGGAGYYAYKHLKKKK